MCSADVDVTGKGGKTFMVKLRSLFGKLWHKEGPEKQVHHERAPKMAPPQISNLATMTEQLRQLKILKNAAHSESDEDDIVVTKVTTVRHSSNDSGYSDKNVDDDDASFKTVQICVDKEFADSKNERQVTKTVEDSAKNEQICEKTKDGAVKHSDKSLKKGERKKPKQLKKVYLSRQPIRNKAPLPSIAPYASRPQQFHQVNHQTFSGCQVTINQAAARTTSDIETIKNNLLNETHIVQTPNSDLTDNEQEQEWNDVLSVIQNDQVVADDITDFIKGLVAQRDSPESEDLNSNVGLKYPSFGTSDPSAYKTLESSKDLLSYNLESNITFGDSNASMYNSAVSDQQANWNLAPSIQYNSNKEPSCDSHPHEFEKLDFGFELCKSNDLNSDVPASKPSFFLTPPPSNESAASTSPNNRSKGDSDSMYSPNRDYSSDISMRHYPPILAENEVFQAIQTEDIPKCVEAKITEKTKEKKKEGCMNLKQFREVMKKMEAGFAELPCCKGQDSSEDLSKQCYKKLSPEVRRRMSLVLASCSLETAYGLLYKLLESLSAGHDREHLLYASFVTICNRILDEKPELYRSEMGLDLLAACCLVCPSRKSLMLHVLGCVRSADRADMNGRRSYVFDTVDISGDNLIGACARRGDECAMVLHELTNHKPGETPLFNVDHVNSEGLTALHLACSCSDTTSRVQTVHVLLAHAGADIWKKDIKSGDLALHHAIRNSPSVFALAMCLFLHADNTKWYSLAKAKNCSSLTPLLKAKGAAAHAAEDSPINQVYRFLSKCRPKSTSVSSETHQH